MKYAVAVAFFIAVLGGACCLSYFWGKSNARVEYVTKEKEVIRYVSIEKSKIQAKPNASRDSLLELMRANVL